MVGPSLWPQVVHVASQGEAHASEAGEAAGVAATVFLVVTLMASAWNLVRRRWIVPRLRGRPAARVMGIIHREVFPTVHGLAGALALVVGIWHGVMEKDHWMLWAAVAVMGLVSVGGLVLQFRWASVNTRRRIFVLHSQQVMTVLLVALLVAGHMLV